jgi:hypothetical protein
MPDADRLRRGAPDPTISFDAFCDLFLERHGATVAKRTKKTIEERLAPARAVFGDWTLRDSGRRSERHRRKAGGAARVGALPADAGAAAGARRSGALAVPRAQPGARRRA